MKRKKYSNEIYTPETNETAEKNKFKIFFILWNLLSIGLFSGYTLIVVYRLAEKTFLSKLIIYLLYIYAAVFLLIILLNFSNSKKLKYKLKNYKSATNFLKYILQIINISLSIITAISALFSTGNLDLGLLLYAILSFLIALFMIMIEIIKVIARKNMKLIKYNLLEIRDKPKKSKFNSNKKT